MRDATPGRIRGRALQTIRARFLYENPYCVVCKRKGRYVAAVEVDHVVPLFKGGADDDSNRQGLCIPCHKAKTNVDLGRRSLPRIGLDGYPITDTPAPSPEDRSLD